MVYLNNKKILPVLSWAIPIGLTLVASFFLAIGIETIYKNKRKGKVTRLILEYIYALNIVIELFVALRVQFPHAPKIIKILCIVTTVSSGIALFCLVGDIIYNNKKKIALQGHRGGLPCLLHCLVSSRGIFGLIGKKESIAFWTALAHFLIRLAETLLRYCGHSFLPKFVSDNDFSIFPFIICLTTWVSRVTDSRSRSSNLITLLVVGGVSIAEPPPGVAEPPPGVAEPPPGVVEPPHGGNGVPIIEPPHGGNGVPIAEPPHGVVVPIAVPIVEPPHGGNVPIADPPMPPQVGGEAPIPDPPEGVAVVMNGQIPPQIPPGVPESAFVNGIVNGNQAYLRKVFDLWSAQITLADGRSLTLNSWTMRLSENDQQIRWLLPAVDFVALHFSLVDEDSVNAINQANGDNPVWVQFLRDHAPDVPIVLVGTDKDARNANAIARQGYFFPTVAGQRLALAIGAIAYEETNVAETPLLVGNLEQLLSGLV